MVGYKYIVDPSYFKINNTTLPNFLHLSKDPISNLLNPRVFGASVLDQIGTITRILSYLFLPLSVVIPLTSFNMFPVLGIAHYLNNVKIVEIDYIAGILCVVGAIILNWSTIVNTKKNTTSIQNYIIGLSLLTLSIIANSFVLVFSKDMADILTPIQSMLNINFGGFFLILAIWLVYTYIPMNIVKPVFPEFRRTFPTAKELKYACLFILSLSNIGFLAYNLSLEYITSIEYSIFSKISIILSLFSGYYFFNEEIGISKILGCIIIIISNILINLNDIERSKMFQKYIRLV